MSLNIEKILKENKKKITSERKVLFSYMNTKHMFSSQELINNFPDIGRASIFRNINLFLDLGILKTFTLKNTNYYELIDDKHSEHEHLECDKCGEISDLDTKQIAKDIIQKAEKMGFSVKRHSLKIVGTCKTCK